MVTLPPYRQQMTTEQGSDAVDEHTDVDDEDDSDVNLEFTATAADDDFSDVSQPLVEVSDDTHVPTDVNVGASSDVAADGKEGCGHR